ncbi:hypothetical protein [Stutzerimonas tarimensis]|uniref:Lipoprotein n=1 Tax=Stutzerimonas tarimensis TaxID=1507735 RepID=A0ABV7TC66_9GAMM
MKTPLAAALLVALGGCAAPASYCDLSETGSACRQQHLLQQNDLIQAQILVTSGGEEGFELAAALLDRAEGGDRRGEVHFYRGLLGIRSGAALADTLAQLDTAASRQHPHAVALLYKIYSEPYLVAEADPERARQYRDAYAELDVARSGYPSFEQALVIVERLLPPQASAVSP